MTEDKVFFEIVMRGAEGQLAFMLDRTPDLLERRDHTGATPLILAAREGNQYHVDILLKRHADFEAVDNAGFTALMHACLYGQGTVAWQLTTAGAYAGRVNKSGMSAASCAHASDFTSLADEMRAVAANEAPVAKAFWAREAQQLNSGTAKALTVRKKPVSFGRR